MGKREEEQRFCFLQSGKAALGGGILAFFVSVVCLFLISFGISEGWIDVSLQYQIVVVFCVFGTFFGGVIATRRCVGKRLLIGVAVGAVAFLLQLTMGLIVFEDFSLEHGGIGILCGSLCGGTAAGILSGGKRYPKVKKRGAKRR